MGEVYAGFDETLQRGVAVKVIAAPHRLSPASRARFLREARILSRLEHPNICRVYDFIEESGAEFLVLELLEGESLDRALAGGLAAPRKLRVARQIAGVLEAAHAEGIVHRDLKPGNVMLTPSGEVKVLDFGLARLAEETPPAAGTAETPSAPAEPDPGSAAAEGATVTFRPVREHHREAQRRESTEAAGRSLHTELGSVVGTPHYMSPEQARGEAATPASDMYSFGLLLQTLWTGRPPYPLELAPGEVLARARRAETLAATGVDADLASLIGRLKSPAPAARPTAATVVERLEWIAGKPKRRLRRLMAAAALAVLALGGLKYTLDLRRERAIAVAARQVADQRRGQAEELIGFMLGDLRKKLEAVGRLEVLDDVGTEAMSYFASVPQDELSDDELLSRSRALYQIGEVRLLRDDADLASALTAFEESLALASDLAEREPASLKRRFELAQSHFWVGYVYWQQRVLDQALEHFEKYFEIAAWLVEREPHNPEWLLELAYAHSNIGSVLEARGDLAGALGRYRETLILKASLAELDPADPERRLELAEQHNLVGVALRQLGELSGAVAEFETELEIKRQLVALDPKRSHWLERLANCHGHLGDLKQSLGDPESALVHLGEDLRLTRQVAASDPTNARWQGDLAVSQINLGRALAARGRLDEGRRETGAGMALLQRLLEQDPSNVAWQLALATGHTRLGGVLEQMAEPAAAEREAERALTLLEARLVADPEGREARRKLSEALNLLGRLRARRGDGEAARSAWQRSAMVIGPLADGSRDPRMLDPWARALLALDRRAEAARVMDVLRAIGYREPGFVELVSQRDLTARQEMPTLGIYRSPIPMSPDAGGSEASHDPEAPTTGRPRRTSFWPTVSSSSGQAPERSRL